VGNSTTRFPHRADADPCAFAAAGTTKWSRQQNSSSSSSKRGMRLMFRLRKQQEGQLGKQHAHADKHTPQLLSLSVPCGQSDTHTAAQ